MSESAVQNVAEELMRLGCKDITANGVKTDDGLVLLQHDEEKSLLPVTELLDLLKGLEVPENAPPDRFVWYMVEQQLAMRGA